jgi:hypothetical protein
MSDHEWDHVLYVNVRTHIRAAALVVPGWLERGHGHFVSTASAAGLPTQIGAAPYAVSKHAVVAFAEWLAARFVIGLPCAPPSASTAISEWVPVVSHAGGSTLAPTKPVTLNLIQRAEVFDRRGIR